MQVFTSIFLISCKKNICFCLIFSRSYNDTNNYIMFGANGWNVKSHSDKIRYRNLQIFWPLYVYGTIAKFSHQAYLCTESPISFRTILQTRTNDPVRGRHAANWFVSIHQSLRNTCFSPFLSIQLLTPPS